MVTYSHILITAFTGDRLQKHNVAVSNKALLIGSFMPDVLLTIINVAYFVSDLLSRAKPDTVASMRAAEKRCERTYFTEPLVIASYNIFHAPILIALLALIGWMGVRYSKRWGASVMWFALGCAFHSGVDILTHYDDGPLLLFPFNWKFRLTAPVSYRDARHGGNVFRIFEHALDIGIIVNFATELHRRKSAKPNVHASHTSEDKMAGRNG